MRLKLKILRSQSRLADANHPSSPAGRKGAVNHFGGRQDAHTENARGTPLSARRRPMTDVAVAGAAGRMGRILVAALGAEPTLRLSAAFEHSDSPFLGSDSGSVAGSVPNDILLRADLAAANWDVLIDFSTPAAVLEHLHFCRDNGRRMVIGTTGLNASQKQSLEGAAKDIAIVFSPNMSVGVNLCFHLIEQAARALGKEADIEILEMHHRDKTDAPSGTALRMGEAAAAARGQDFDKAAVYQRQGQTGARPDGAIGFAALRGGSAVGEHTVLFALGGERVEITHRAESRMAFALGAVRAARWVCGMPPGLYDMQDVLKPKKKD